MGGESLNLLVESPDDELDIFIWKALYHLLYDMIAILIVDAFQNGVLQLADKTDLLIEEHMFQGLDVRMSKSI